MKQGVQWKVAQLFTWFLARLAPNPKLFEQNLDTSMKTLDTLWQTPAVHQYLDGREALLKEIVVNAVLDGQQVQADKTAGGLHEIRALRDKLSAAHAYIARQRDALSKASK